MSEFDRLHPALQHHIVNSLGWKALRPVQEQAIAPLLAGDHALILGPTAGGKTEAALFPLLSRMLSEGWQGLSLLYVCPIKALLNNLEPRLQAYASLLGRRVELWHGDVCEGMRRQIRRDPPDVLLTTPESLEAMLVSRRSDRHALFGQARAAVVDELHAFAGDDRGWHLLAVLERIRRIAGRDLQRVGLSATIGNPADLLAWLAAGDAGERRVIAPGDGSVAPVEVGLDFVGSLANAARVVAGLHRGEKRLVFVDSRARVEALAAALREAGTATFVSHSSLSLDERRRAEAAFAEGTDCAIVATSTLELGIDVGDLDRVVQVDAPTTVSAFLQRLGRTGRRPGATRNCLFLATSDDALLRAAGLVQLWSEGYVEPVTPPPEPFHVLAQQLLGLALQEGGIGRSRWPDWIGRVPAFAAMAAEDRAAVLDHMIGEGLLFEEAGLLSMGPEGERSLGYWNFVELCSVFTSAPLFTVLHGRAELGQVHEVSFQVRGAEPAVLLLGGRSWLVTHLDWLRRLAYVEPTALPGRSRWLGGGGALHFDLCRAIRRVLGTGHCPGTLSRRATDRLDRVRDELAWVDEESTAVVRDASGHMRWWTFAGLRANASLAAALAQHAEPREPENLAIALRPDARVSELRERLRNLEAEAVVGALRLPPAALDGLKFAACLPPALAERPLRRRLADVDGVRRVLAEPVRSVEIG